MAEKGLHELFAKVYYVDETISIQKYYQPLPLKNHQSFEIGGNIDAQLIPDLYDEVLRFVGCVDLRKNCECTEIMINVVIRVERNSLIEKRLDFSKRFCYFRAQGEVNL